MSRAEYWLLECAWKYYIRVGQLSGTANDSYEAQKRPRDVSNEQIVDVLHSLFQRGDVKAVAAKERFGECFDRPSPSREETAHVLVEGGYSLGYGLTAQGGARFEEITQIRWEMYVESWFDSNRDGIWEYDVTAMNLGLINEYLDQAESAGIVVVGTVERDRLEPWEATYWKVLPFGERLLVHVKSNDLDWPKQPDWGQYPSDLT